MAKCPQCPVPREKYCQAEGGHRRYCVLVRDGRTDYVELLVRIAEQPQAEQPQPQPRKPRVPLGQNQRRL